MFGRDFAMTFAEQTHFEILFECSTDTSANRQREKKKKKKKNTESVIYCCRPAKRVLFYTSRCSPVFSSPHQQKIKCCWNPAPFQEDCHYYLPTFTTGWLSLIFLSIFYQGSSEQNRGQMEETKREKMKARGGDDECRCMLGKTRHTNAMFFRSNDESAGLTDGLKCLRPGERVKDIEFPCLDKIGFNVYTELLCSKGIRGSVRLCTFRG